MPTLTALLHRQPIAGLLTWLLPPALAIAAISVYFGLIVPAQKQPWYTPPPPKPGQSITAKAVRKIRSVEADIYYRARATEINAKNTAARAPASKRPAPTKPTVEAEDPGGEPRPDLSASAIPAMTTARPSSAVDALWERHHAAPLADEPIDPAYARAHRPILESIFSVVRDRVFAGAPDPTDASVVDVECHVVRCAVSIASRYRHDLTLLAEAVGRVQRDRRSLWREYSVGAVTDPDDASGRSRVVVTLAFTDDLPQIDDLTVDGKRLARASTRTVEPK